MGGVCTDMHLWRPPELAGVVDPPLVILINELILMLLDTISFLCMFANVQSI